MHAHQRNSKRTHPCYVCGGVKELPQGRGVRCSGYVSQNGDFQYCQREEQSGGLAAEDNGLYQHILNRPCRCGRTHDTGLPPPTPPDPSPRTPSSNVLHLPPDVEYFYLDERGNALFSKARRGQGDAKVLWLRHPELGANGEWAMVDGLGEATLSLYNLDVLAQSPDDLVFLVEGEKDADTLGAHGLVATTLPDGAHGQWREQYDAPLRDRAVVILPDNDDPGRAYADRALRNLRRLGAQARIVTLPGLAPKGDVTDWLQAGNTIDLLHDLVAEADEEPEPEAEPAEEGRPAPKYRSLGLSELERLPPPRFVLERILQARSVSMVYGEPGSAKSFLVFDWGLCVAAEQMWMGRSVRPGRTLYVAAENAQGYAVRALAWRKRQRHPQDTARFFLLPQALDISERENVHRLLQDHPGTWAMVVFDTLSECTGGADDTEQGRMKLAFANCRWLAEQTGAAVVVVHHPAKGGGGPRGSSVMAGHVDTVVKVEKSGDVLVHCEKQRNGAPFDDINLALKEVEIDGMLDEEGFPLTSCYLVRAGVAAEVASLGREEKSILRALSARQGHGLTRAELRALTGLDERWLYRNLEKLSYAGLVGHQGWSTQEVRRYWVTMNGAEAVGMRAPTPDAAVNPPTIPAMPDDSCPFCAGTAWVWDGTAWVCSPCTGGAL